jgi:hypothetical protein
MVVDEYWTVENRSYLAVSTRMVSHVLEKNIVYYRLLCGVVRAGALGIAHVRHGYVNVETFDGGSASDHHCPTD